jgi:hypothetical protein
MDFISFLQSHLEYLHHICYLPQCPEHPADSTAMIRLLPAISSNVYPLYYISIKGHVYQTTMSHIFLSLKRTDVTTLPANVREALQQEIDVALER